MRHRFYYHLTEQEIEDQVHWFLRDFVIPKLTLTPHLEDRRSDRATEGGKDTWVHPNGGGCQWSIEGKVNPLGFGSAFNGESRDKKAGTISPSLSLCLPYSFKSQRNCCSRFNPSPFLSNHHWQSSSTTIASIQCRCGSGPTSPLLVVSMVTKIKKMQRGRKVDNEVLRFHKDFFNHQV